MGAIFHTAKDAIIYSGRKFEPDFNLDDDDRRLNYRKVFNCLCGSELCDQLGVKPNKGILLLGDKGVGKTLLMRVMHVLFKDTPRRFRWVNSMEIYDMLREGKDEVDIKQMYGRGLRNDLYIDDIGVMEKDFHKYKNTLNIISEIIFERNELFVLDGFRTHFSTNLRTAPRDAAPGQPPTSLPDEKNISAMYGDRAYDRIKQMCNLIVWKGKSLRK